MTLTSSSTATSAVASTAAVRLRGVTKFYGSGATRVPALRGVDLDVTTGEVLMLVGPSGCGKTTLISIIAGILDRDEGESAVFGTDFSTLSQRERTARRGRELGFVFQAFNLLPTLTAAENAAVPLLINGVEYITSVQRGAAMLERVGLGARTDALPAQLSGGQQQRVAIARSLVHAPKLIVCDEPTSALDHQTGQSVMELLRDLARSDGRTLIIVTHDARIFSYADRIVRMDDGRVVGEGAESAQEDAKKSKESHHG